MIEHAAVPAMDVRTSVWHRALVVLAVSLATVLWFYRSTVVSIWAAWERDPFGHGYLVVPAVLYLTWTCRENLRRRLPAPSLWRLPVLALLSFGWLLGSLTGTTIVQQFFLVAICIAIVWCCLGNAATKALLFPLAFMVFALPLGDRVIPMLQDFTARFAVVTLQLLRVPALLEGHVISIPGSNWRVAEACSGINYLVASLAVGYIYAGLVYKYWRHRIGFVFASALVPLVANGIRVTTTILIASWGATGIAAGMEHNLYGILVFGVITYALLATCGRWRESESSTEEPNENGERAASRGALTVVVAAVALIFAAAPPMLASKLSLDTVPDEYLHPAMPRVSGPWRPVDRDAFMWSPSFIVPTSQIVGTYGSGSASVKLYLAYYAASQPAVKLAADGNVLFGQPWWVTGEDSLWASIDGRSVRVHETMLSSPGASLRVWRWYLVNGTPTGSDYHAKWLLAKARLFRSPQGSAIIAIATDDVPGRDATATLRNFLQHTLFSPSLDMALDRR